jgi:hypothetical protein
LFNVLGNEIDGQTIKCLTEAMMAELIPSIRHRIKFMTLMKSSANVAESSAHLSDRVDEPVLQEQDQNVYIDEAAARYDCVCVCVWCCLWPISTTRLLAPIILCGFSLWSYPG